MLQAMIVIFGFMLLGFLVWYKEETTRSLSRLCLYVLIPILIFESITKAAIPLQTVFIMIAHFFLTTLLVYGILFFGGGRLLGWKNDQLKWNALSSTLANVGYFGLAVIRFGLGADAVPYAIAVVVAFNLYMALIGFSQAGNITSFQDRLRMLAKNPYLYAFIISIVWKWCSLQMPVALDDFIGLAVKVTLPITLLLTGAEMRRNGWKLAGMKEALQITVIKLIFPLLLAWPLASLFTSNPIERNVMILMFGMPTSINLLLLANDNNRDTSVLSMSILLTTVLSPVTLLGFIQLLSL